MATEAFAPSDVSEAGGREAKLLDELVSAECRGWPALETEWLYVGHADAPRYTSALRMELFADRRLPPEGEVDTFCSVVGSWSFMSLLPSLRPRRLLLFDRNPAPVAFVAMVFGLLRLAPTRREFLSLFLARRLSSEDLHGLEAEAIAVMKAEGSGAAQELLRRPVDLGVVTEALRGLGRDGAAAPRPPGCAYADFLREFLVDPGARDAPLGQGEARPWRICDVLRVVGHPMSAPVNVGRERAAGSPPNACSLFLSHGWLSSDAAYRLVRSRVMAAKSEFVVANFLQEGAGRFRLHGSETTVLYLSNIQPEAVVEWLGQDALAAKLQELMGRVSGAGGYMRVLNRDRWYAFDSRPHLSALLAVERALQEDVRRLGCAGAEPTCAAGRPALPLVEVVAQDLRVHPNWGFHELNRSKVLHHAEFRAEVQSAFPGAGERYVLPLFERVCLLHILLGEGLGIDDFRLTLQLATASCRRVAVVEHNRRSLDFREHTAAESFLDPDDLREMLREICTEWRRALTDCSLVRLECAYGTRDHCRNFVALVEVWGTAVHGVR